MVKLQQLALLVILILGLVVQVKADTETMENNPTLTNLTYISSPPISFDVFGRGSFTMDGITRYEFLDSFDTEFLNLPVFSGELTLGADFRAMPAWHGAEFDPGASGWIEVNDEIVPTPVGPTPVPEPLTLGLFATGLLAAAYLVTRPSGGYDAG